MTPPAVPLGRKLFTLAVAGVLLILPLFYVAALGGLAYGLFWLATSSYGHGLSPAIFWIAMVVGVLLLLCAFLTRRWHEHVTDAARDANCVRVGRIDLDLAAQARDAVCLWISFGDP